jgi:hypothetical protein
MSSSAGLPRLVFGYRGGRLTPYLVDERRCYPFKRLERRFPSFEDAARWRARRFPSASLTTTDPIRTRGAHS